MLLGRPLDEDFAPSAALEEVLSRCEVLVLGASSNAGADDLADLRAAGALSRVEIVVNGFERESERAALPFDELEHLMLVHSLTAGVEDLLAVGLHERKIALTNSAGCYANGIAEYVLSMIVALLRDLPPLFVASARGEWRAHRLGRELASCRVGVLGYGGIGRRVAELAAGWGAQVWCVTRRPAAHVDARDPHLTGPGTVRLSGLERLPEMLAASDVLVVAAGLNPTSRRLLGAGELAALPAGALLVNVARGDVLDEPALVEALSSGALGGAVLDTTAVEPLPAEHPLWRLDNVWITPHIAGGTEEGRTRVADLLAHNIACCVEGRLDELRNVVDIAAELGLRPSEPRAGATRRG